MLFLIGLSNLFTSGFIHFKEKKELKGRKSKEINENEMITNPMVEWNVNYERTIEYLKKHEGFAGGEVYICPGGYSTIGYGHLIVEGENFDKLTKNQADSLLRVDFNKALKVVDKTIKISGLRKLAIAHFVFSKGIGTFLNSELKEKIILGESIDNELMEYCYYTNIDGIRILSQNAVNIRRWEIALYNLKS